MKRTTVILISMSVLVIFFVVKNKTSTRKNKDQIVEANQRIAKTIKLDDSKSKSIAKAVRSVRNDRDKDLPNNPIIQLTRNPDALKKKNSWKKPSPFFSNFIKLIENPLLQDRQEKLYEILNDTQVLNQSKDILTKTPSENGLNLFKERERLDAVEYIATVISELDPLSDQRDQAIAIAVEIIQSQRIYHSYSQDLKKSMVGDQVELGIQIAISCPKIWSELKKNNHNPRFQRLANYIDKQSISVRIALNSKGK